MHPHSIDQPGMPLSPRRTGETTPHGASPHTASPRKTPEMFSRDLKQLNDDIGPHGTLMTPVFLANGLVAKLLARIPVECGESQQQAALELADLCRLVASQLTQAEQAYEISEHGMSLTCLAAAKANQVRLLGQIDRLDGPPGGAMQFTGAHHLCVELGDRISTILLHTRDKADAGARNTSRSAFHPGSPPLFQSPRKACSKDAAKLDRTPLHQQSDLQGRQADTPSPARQSTPTSTSGHASSPRQKKRAQGSDVSPTMKNSPSKRHRTDGGQAAPGASSPGDQEPVALPATGSAADCAKPSGRITSPRVPILDWTKARPRGDSPRSPSRTTPRAAQAADADALSSGTRRADATPTMASALSADALSETSATGGEERVPALAPPSPLSPIDAPSPPVSPRARVGSPNSPLDRLRPMSPSRTFTIKGKVRKSAQPPRSREHGEQGSGEVKAESASVASGMTGQTRTTGTAHTTARGATGTTSTTTTTTTTLTDLPIVGGGS